MGKELVLMLFFFSFLNRAYSDTLKSKMGDEFDNKKDSIQDYTDLKILKINPNQFLFSEIPISFEVFHKLKSSTQFQLGFIFPYNQEFPPRHLFESYGRNGNASSKGLLSYRNSPYNSYGLSLKIEFRKYGRYLYYAPQIMYKYCFYNKETFPVDLVSATWDQTESKSSNIFGLGFMIGRQSYHGSYIIDRYVGFGFRARSLSYRIIAITNPWHPEYNKYPNEERNSFSFYPFVNLGIRIGVKL